MLPTRLKDITRVLTSEVQLHFKRPRISQDGKNQGAVKKPNGRDVNCYAHRPIQNLLARSQSRVRVCVSVNKTVSCELSCRTTDTFKTITIVV